MLVNETELKNGMRVVHQQVGYSKLSHLGIFINVGSRDEEEDERKRERKKGKKEERKNERK